MSGSTTDPGRPRYGCLYKHLLAEACALPGASGLVFACLVAHADPDGSSCFPSRATIAKTIGRKITAVREALRLLRMAGLIEHQKFMPRGVVMWRIPGMRIAAQMGGYQPTWAETGTPDGRISGGQVGGYPPTTKSSSEQRQDPSRSKIMAAPLPEKDRASPSGAEAVEAKRPAAPSRWGNRMKKLPPLDPASLPEPGSYPDNPEWANRPAAQSQ